MSLPAPCATTRPGTAPRGHSHSPETPPRPVVISIDPGTVRHYRRERDALPGDLGRRLQGMEGPVLPGDAEGPGDAGLLRAAVPLGRDQLHVPAAALGADAHDVEGADARGIHVRV